ncbi:MAG: AAA family ATPase [Desulfobacterales bacterium]|jgi:hypothetical protein
MLKTDLILRNPLSLIGSRVQGILSRGGFGAVLARAGVGKTAFLVQVSLNFLLREQNVLHVSLNDPIKKVDLWYQEVFSHIARQYDVNQVQELWETLLPHRFIMTFRIEGFSARTLEERLTDLTEQKIFSPRMIIIDGLPFDASAAATLKQLRSLARKNSLQIWFAVRTHRHEAPGPDGMPGQLKNVVDLFDLAVELQPRGDEIHIAVIKVSKDPTTQLPLLLDPATMLIKKQAPASPAP